VNQPRSESGRFDSAEEATVVVIGGANIDHKSQTLTRPEFGTSNPGRSRTSAGGVGRNVAENLARLGVRTVLVSAIGNDAAGVSLRRETESAGVDLAHSVAAAGATAVLNRDRIMRQVIAGRRILPGAIVGFIGGTLPQKVKIPADVRQGTGVRIGLHLCQNLPATCSISYRKEKLQTASVALSGAFTICPHPPTVVDPRWSAGS